MNKKTLSLLLAIILVLSVALVGCKKEEPTTEAPAGEETTGEETTGGDSQFLTIATGGVAGAYYPLGGALANIYNTIDGITANVQSTGASIENIGLIAEKEADVAFIQNDVTYYAWEGIESFDGKPVVENIRGLAVLYPEVVQIIAGSDSGINSVEDLKGKKVAVGAPGSGTEVNARQILEAYGITYDDITEDFLSFNEAADQLKNKQVDAAFVTAALPTSAVTEVTQTADIKVIPVDSSIIDGLKAEYPFYAEVVVPGGTYKGNDEDVVATAVMAMLVVNEDLDEDLAYEMTKQMYEQIDTIIASHARGEDIKLEQALDGMPITVHPGAQRYFDENGVK